eukprot:TRINITY_DN21364_c0_g1_i3.p1 TRINITY_DN21364_c0_g1~~TRINITY_DN21364_c0_g1_i3.p1  ORF type:complete len:283 (-),score=-19.42 TRINITY_DN21364_c0_g1_i3:32-808(-)
MSQQPIGYTYNGIFMNALQIYMQAYRVVNQSEILRKLCMHCDNICMHVRFRKGGDLYLYMQAYRTINQSNILLRQYVFIMYCNYVCQRNGLLTNHRLSKEGGCIYIYSYACIATVYVNILSYQPIRDLTMHALQQYMHAYWIIYRLASLTVLLQKTTKVIIVTRYQIEGFITLRTCLCSSVRDRNERDKFQFQRVLHFYGSFGCVERLSDLFGIFIVQGYLAYVCKKTFFILIFNCERINVYPYVSMHGCQRQTKDGV